MTRIMVLNGFLDTKSGNVRDKKTLAKLDAEGAKASSDKLSFSTANSEKSVSNAISQVRARTYEQINTASNNTQSALADVKSAKKLVKKEISTLKNLEQALKDGNKEEALKQQAEYQKLQEERTQLAQQISSNNQTRTSQSIRIGNQELLKVDSPKIDFAAANETVDLKDKNSVKELRQSLATEERQQLNTTQAKLKSDLNNLKAVSKAVDSGLADLISNDTLAKEGFLRDFESAKDLANNTSTKLTAVGSQAVLYQNLTESSLKLLS